MPVNPVAVVEVIADERVDDVERRQRVEEVVIVIRVYLDGLLDVGRVAIRFLLVPVMVLQEFSRCAALDKTIGSPPP